MPTISRETAFNMVYQAPLGRGMLGMYEALAGGAQLSRADKSGDQELVTLMGSMRNGDAVNRAVTLFSNGLFTNLRLTDLTRVVGQNSDQELGRESSLVFSFEVGTFDRGMRRVSADWDQAPFNGMVRRVDEGLYTAESPESAAYRRSLASFERAFAEEFRNTHKMRIMD